jgi:hypothetical protein
MCVPLSVDRHITLMISRVLTGIGQIVEYTRIIVDIVICDNVFVDC